MTSVSSAGKPSPPLSPAPFCRPPPVRNQSRSSIPDEPSLSPNSSCPINLSSDTDCGFLSCRSEYPDDDDSVDDGNGDGKTVLAEDVFRISSKEASVESLRKWRKAALVLNATRRFRYTTSLSRNEDSLQRFRQGAIAVRAANRFKSAAVLSRGPAAQGLVVSPPTKEGFGISQSTLCTIIKETKGNFLEQLGGVAEIAKALHSDLVNGISRAEEDIQQRKSVFGGNTFPRKPSKTLLWFIWEAFHDTTLVILIVCAVISLIFGIRSHGFKEGWYDGTSIAIAVLLVVLVTAISDYKQSLQFRDLNAEKENILLNVQRGGKRCQVSIYDIVVGDIVPLSIGNQVPADGLFIRGHQMSVDESSLTGESEPIVVDQRHPYLLSGSKIVEGYGDMLVICVGTNTEWGQIMATMSGEVGEETPLQVRLNGVATFIGKVGLSVAFIVFVVLIVFYFTSHTGGSDNVKFKAGQTKATAAVNSVVDIFSIAVTIIVVAVPEGLPLAVTLTLAYSMKKMMVDKALVRRLSACETMGSATTICSDKTGTLTLNQMTIVKSWVAGKLSETSDGPQLPDKIWHLLFEGIAFNTTASVFVPLEGGNLEVSGTPTEKAVLLWGLKAGMDFAEVTSKGAALQVEVFNSVKKRAGVAVRLPPGNGDGNGVRVHWKGAAEIVVYLCTKLLNSNGSESPIDGKKREELVSIINGMAASSLRCLAFAFKLISLEDMPEDGGEQMAVWQIPESELTLAAIVGIKDPCRPEVFDAVRRCQAAGIEVRMVTGDNLATAKAIAAECGIFKAGYEAIEGSEFRAMSEDDAKIRVPKICIMARSLPMDKLRLVKVLKALGQVVAVTGDGTNDAPALHEADVGLSMGIQGTEVAKESSDIVILDDNFASVVNVVCWGRSVYANIQKFIQFQLTVNVAALTINFVAAVSSGRVPLTAVQLLWVNLIMDTLGALALATEPPNEDLMKGQPVGRDSPLITNQMWFHIVSQASYQVAVLLTLQFRGDKILGLSGPHTDLVQNTIIFNSFVFCQIFNEVNARKPGKLNIFQGLFQNHLFLGIVGGTVVAQALIVQFLQKFAATTGLDWRQWLFCVVVGFVSWPIAFVVKFLPLPAKPIISGQCKCCCLK